MKQVKQLLSIATIYLIGFSGAAQTATTIQELGEALFFDENISLNTVQVCSSCHDPNVGFVDPDNVQNGTPVSDGSITTETGG